MAAGANALVTTQHEEESNIWTAAPGEDASSARQITFGPGRNEGNEGLSVSPDGRIVYVSKMSGNLDIWSMDRDGSNQKQLTFTDDQEFIPGVSPDGRYVVFLVTHPSAVMRMNIDGSDRRKLIEGGFFSCISPDGEWVVYASNRDNFKLWKRPVEGGDAVQLTDAVALVPIISPDGKLIAYSSDRKKIVVIPFGGGPPIATFDHMRPAIYQVFAWTRDASAMTYVVTKDGVTNIWLQPLAGGPPRQLTNFKSDLIFRFDWTPDGKQLVLARGQMNSDVVLMRDSR